MTTRRTFAHMILAGVTGLLAACGAAGGGGAAQAGGAAGEFALGPANAKVTVIEYASMTCHACQQFHVQDYPKLKAEYIDTGKIRYIMRPFPGAGYSPQISMAQFLLASCIATDAPSYYGLISTMFTQFDATASAAQAGQIRTHLMQFAQSAGLSPERFETCITDRAAMDRINAAQKTAGEQFQIDRTPTFVINGQKVEPNTFAGLKPLIDAQLAR